jgi:hypothetical protein
MHTIVLVNQECRKQLESFDFLFREFDDQMTICQVDEQGNSFDEVFPNLRQEIMGLHEWRAMLVMNPPLPNLARETWYNPFDVKQNPEANDYVRLSQLLLNTVAHDDISFDDKFFYIDSKGNEHSETGSPEPSVALRHAAVLENVAIQHTYIKRVTMEATEEQRSALYNRPSKVLFYRMRNYQPSLNRFYEEKKFDESNEQCDFDVDSHYPEQSRFVTFDLSNYDESVEDAMLVKFGLGLLTLVMNPWHAAWLQAHRFYQLSLDYDLDMLSALISDKLSKNFAVVDKIKDLLQFQENLSEDEVEDVYGEKTIEIVTPKLDPSDARIDVKAYGIAKDRPMDDKLTFDNQTSKSLQEIRKQVRTPRRDIANRARDMYEEFTLFKRQYYPAPDGHQVRELQEDMQERRQKIFPSLNNAYLYGKKIDDALLNKRDDLQCDLRPRVYSKSIFALAGLIIILTLASLGVIAWQSWDKMEAVRDGSIILLVVVGSLLATIFLNRYFVRRNMATYNQVVDQVYTELGYEVKQVESRFNNIFNYMRDRRFIQLAEAEGVTRMNRRIALKQHQRHLIAFNDYLSKLAKQIGLRIRKIPVYDVAAYFNPLIPQEDNAMYRFQRMSGIKVPLNGNYDRISIPYQGISGVKLTDITKDWKGGDE